MEILKYIMPPLIGAIIGYFTNLIAVKMLFHPYNPIKIGKFTLPLTPGVIPKRKKAIAHAVGNAIENDLISREDLKQVLLSEKVKSTVIGGIVHALLDEETSVEARLSEQLGEESYAHVFETVQDKICRAVEHGVGKLDLSALLSDQGMDAIDSYISSSMPMVSLFLNREKLQSIVQGFGTYLTAYLSEHAAELLHDPVGNKMHNLASHSPSELLTLCHLDAALLEKLMESAYLKVVNEKADVLLREIHIGAIAEDKIAHMDNRKLEKLTLSVMRHELNTIINLGALLGALIGTVNIFF